jgi:hypothetical protein
LSGSKAQHNIGVLEEKLIQNAENYSEFLKSIENGLKNPEIAKSKYLVFNTRNLASEINLGNPDPFFEAVKFSVFTGNNCAFLTGWSQHMTTLRETRWGKPSYWRHDNALASLNTAFSSSTYALVRSKIEVVPERIVAGWDWDVEGERFQLAEQFDREYNRDLFSFRTSFLSRGNYHFFKDDGIFSKDKIRENIGDVGMFGTLTPIIENVSLDEVLKIQGECQDSFKVFSADFSNFMESIRSPVSKSTLAEICNSLYESGNSLREELEALKRRHWRSFGEMAITSTAISIAFVKESVLGQLILSLYGGKTFREYLKDFKEFMETKRNVKLNPLYYPQEVIKQSLDNFYRKTLK